MRAQESNWKSLPCHGAKFGGKVIGNIIGANTQLFKNIKSYHIPRNGALMVTTTIFQLESGHQDGDKDGR